jgi:hypothetical protein
VVEIVLASIAFFRTLHHLYLSNSDKT